MKYKILPFIVGIMLAGCGAKHGSGEQTIGVTDSIPQTPKSGSLIDSVFDPEFKKLVLNDSIELLQVAHFMRDTMHGEEILYLDHRTSNAFKQIERHSHQQELIDLLQCRFIDSLTHITNPFHEMNGTYVTISSYRGSFVTSYDEFEQTPTISDTSIFINQMMSVNCPYISAIRKDNIITYKIIEEKIPVSIDIKKLGGKHDAQLWKGFGQDEYEIRVPIEKTISIPELVYTNNIGIGVDGNIHIQFDAINYDSLMNSK